MVVAPSEPEPTPPPAPTGAEAPSRFRLKPKITAEPEVEAVPPPSAQPVAPVAPFIPVDSVSATPAPVVPSSDEPISIPRLRLRPVEAGSAKPAPPLGVSAQEPAAELVAVGMSPPAFVAPSPPLSVDMPPVDAVAPEPEESPLPSGPDTSAAPVTLPAVSPPPSAKAALKPPAKKSQARAVLMLIALVVIAGGGAAYFFLMGEGAPEPVAVIRPPVPGSQTPATAPGSEAPVPKPVVRPSSVFKIEPLPPPPSAVMAAAVAKQVPVRAVMTPAFRAWIDEARITGVVSGASPRVIINGRLMRPGDMVDASAGIVFDSLDPERKRVMFRDGTGMLAGKGY